MYWYFQQIQCLNIRKTYSTKHTTLSEQFQNIILKYIERGNIDIPNTQIHDQSPSWLGTGTSIKRGGVKLVL